MAFGRRESRGHLTSDVIDHRSVLPGHLAVTKRLLCRGQPTMESVSEFHCLSGLAPIGASGLSEPRTGVRVTGLLRHVDSLSRGH